MGFCSIVKDTFKPPPLVFFVTLTALAVTLFVFSISMELNKNKILNPDIQSWNMFYQTISSLGVCYIGSSKNKKSAVKPKTTELLPHSKIMEDTANQTKVSFLTEAKLSIDGVIQRNYYIESVIKAKYLGHPKSDKEIIMTISVPKVKKKTSKLACISLVGPSELFPDVSVTLPKCTPPKKTPQEKLLLMLPEEVKEAALCPSGHFGSLNLKQKDKLNVYLSKMDTKLIQMHILVMSVVLCIMVFIFLLYSLCGKFLKGDRSHPTDQEFLVSQE